MKSQRRLGPPKTPMMDPWYTRMSCKPEGRPEVMPMAGECVGACLSMLRRSHQALHDVEPAFLAAPRPSGQPSKMTRRGRERRQERQPSSRPSPATMTRLWDHLAASTTTHLTLTASACVLARGRQKMTLSLSFKASRPLPAASVVADTYLEQAGAGWPACCEHVEVMLPG